MINKLTTILFLLILILGEGCQNRIVGGPFQVETRIADQSYMSECKKNNSRSTTEQIGYHGIFPGKTRMEQVELLIGVPNDVVPSVPEDPVESWYYDEVTIDFKNGVVYLVITEENLPTIMEMERTHGCPDVVIDRLAEIEEQPQRTYFVYYSLGMELSVENVSVPLNIDTRLGSISYFEPVDSFNEYINKPNVIYDPATSFILSWSELDFIHMILERRLV